MTREIAQTGKKPTTSTRLNNAIQEMAQSLYDIGAIDHVDLYPEVVSQELRVLNKHDQLLILKHNALN